LLLFFQKKKILTCSFEKKNQKTFVT